MRLSAYLDANWKTRSAFAEAIGVSRQALSRYESGQRRPEWDVLVRISEVTSGAVTPNDFLPEAPGPEGAEDDAGIPSHSPAVVDGPAGEDATAGDMRLPVVAEGAP